MDTTIAATVREDRGKGAARRSRARGTLPAIMYGPHTPPKALAIDPAVLTNIFKESQDRNTVLNVRVGDDAPVACLVREVQRHPLSRQIMHVDLYAVSREDQIEVMVPLAITGRAKGATLGGRIRFIRREIKATCRYDQIPHQFVVDVTPMDIGDMVKASEIPLPEGVSLVYDHDYNVITLYGKRRSAVKKN